MRWSEFAQKAPRLAALGRERLIDPGVVLIGTVRRDGDAGEYKVRGRAIEERRPTTEQRYAIQVRNTLGWSPERGRFHLFRIDLDDVTFIRYDEPTGDQFVTRWPMGQEFVRRGTSATSLGDPEPYRDLLDDG